MPNVNVNGERLSGYDCCYDPSERPVRRPPSGPSSGGSPQGRLRLDPGRLHCCRCRRRRCRRRCCQRRGPPAGQGHHPSRLLPVLPPPWLLLPAPPRPWPGAQGGATRRLQPLPRAGPLCSAAEGCGRSARAASRLGGPRVRSARASPQRGPVRAGRGPQQQQRAPEGRGRRQRAHEPGVAAASDRHRGQRRRARCIVAAGCGLRGVAHWHRHPRAPRAPQGPPQAMRAPPLHPRRSGDCCCCCRCQRKGPRAVVLHRRWMVGCCRCAVAQQPET